MLAQPHSVLQQQFAFVDNSRSDRKCDSSISFRNVMVLSHSWVVSGFVLRVILVER